MEASNRYGTRAGMLSAIATGYRHTAVLKPDGTVMASGDNKYGQCEVSGWRDMAALAAGSAHMGSSHTVGLRTDGTVAAVGWNKYDQCNVSGWRNIVAVAAGWRRTVGLQADGTVVAVGRNNEGQCNVSDWDEIVAVTAGDWHTVGLLSDGCKRLARYCCGGGWLCPYHWSSIGWYGGGCG